MVRLLLYIRCAGVNTSLPGMLYSYVKDIEFDVASSSLMTVTSSLNETGALPSTLRRHLLTLPISLSNNSPHLGTHSKAPLNLSIA